MFLAATVAFVLAGCSDRPPNVLLVTIDTLRADRLGAYGGPLPTPVLDRLASEGVLLERTYSPTPTTAPAHATIFSGRFVQNHGTIGNGPLSLPGLPLVDAFRSAGYDTAGFVSSYVLSPKLGWGKSFAHYDAHFGADSGLRDMNVDLGPMAGMFAGESLDRAGMQTTTAARAWIDTAHEPFFLWVHYFDPHAPYRLRPPYVRKMQEAHYSPPLPEVAGYTPDQLNAALLGYEAEVLYVDEVIEGLLDALRSRGFLDRTLVVVTADHGEGLGQHGWMAHTVYLYDEQIHVPWILRWPGHLPAGTRIATPVGLVDLAPTIAALAGVQLSGPVDGSSLAESLRKGAEPAARPVFGIRPAFLEPVSGHLGEERSVRADGWKYIRSGDRPEELYRMDADPTELRNVIQAHPDETGRLRALLDEHVRAQRHDATQPGVTDSERERLRALGYVQ